MARPCARPAVSPRALRWQMCWIPADAVNQPGREKLLERRRGLASRCRGVRWAEHSPGQLLPVPCPPDELPEPSLHWALAWEWRGWGSQAGPPGSTGTVHCALLLVSVRRLPGLACLLHLPPSSAIGPPFHDLLTTGRAAWTEHGVSPCTEGFTGCRRLLKPQTAGRGVSGRDPSWLHFQSLPVFSPTHLLSFPRWPHAGAR